MEKDAYYFPHFSNARTDRKIKRVIKELGVEGYGIYFMILEVLRDQSGFKYPMGDLDLLADEFNTSEQKVRTVVCNYQLFQVDDEQNFFSLKFNEFLEPYLEMKEQRRIAGIASGVARRKKAEEQALLNGCSTGVQRELNENEQSKVKESKEKKIYNIIPPTVDMVNDYCIERGNSIDPQIFIDFYGSKGWVIGKSKMKDWQATIRTWEKSSTKQQEPPRESRSRSVAIDNDEPIRRRDDF